jgi:hypothetical protein
MEMTAFSVSDYCKAHGDGRCVENMYQSLICIYEASIVTHDIWSIIQIIIVKFSNKKMKRKVSIYLKKNNQLKKI